MSYRDLGIPLLNVRFTTRLHTTRARAMMYKENDIKRRFGTDSQGNRKETCRKVVSELNIPPAEDKEGVAKALAELEAGKFSITGRDKLFSVANFLIQQLGDCENREYVLRILCKVCEESKPFVEQLVQVQSLPLLIELLECGDIRVECFSLKVIGELFNTLFSTRVFFERELFAPIVSLYETMITNGCDSKEISSKLFLIEDIFNMCFRFMCDWPHEAISSVCRLYSLALQVRRVDSFVAVAVFVHNFVDIDRDDAIALLWEHGIPQELWKIFYEDRFNIPAVNALASLAFCESEELKSQTLELVKVEALLESFMMSDDEEFVREVLKCIEIVCCLNPEAFALITSAEVITKLARILQDAEFHTKFAVAAVLHAAITAGNNSVVRRIFSTDIMLSTLDLYDEESPRAIVPMLRAASRALQALNKFGIEAYDTVNMFEKRYMELVKDLLLHPDRTIQETVKELAMANFPDLLAPSPTAISHSILDV